jgi:hypothetical protein
VTFGGRPVERGHALRRGCVALLAFVATTYTPTSALASPPRAEGPGSASETRGGAMPSQQSALDQPVGATASEPWTSVSEGGVAHAPYRPRTRAEIFADPRLRRRLHTSRFMIVAGSGVLAYGGYWLFASGALLASGAVGAIDDRSLDEVDGLLLGVGALSVVHAGGLIAAGTFLVIRGEVRRRALYRGDDRVRRVHVGSRRSRHRVSGIQLSPHLGRQSFGFGVSGRF